MRRSLATGIAAAVVLALAGCVGIPTSGGVNDGAVIDDQVTPDFVVLPKDPVPGSSQEQILTDFMQALSGPQGGYAVAKKYLTSTLATTWDPDAGAIIRSGGYVIEQAGADTFTYSFSSRAIVNNLGQYQEQADAADQTLTFGFAQENGEWRISQAADGIVLSQSAFNVAFRERPLFFFDPSYTYLIPDVRWFPARQSTSTSVVRALLAGPSTWLQQAVVTAFPDATAIGEPVVDSGGVTVDLSTEALSASPLARDRMRQQLVASLDVSNIQMTVRGIELETPDSTGDRALVNPNVDAPVLVGGADGTAFGFDGGSGISQLGSLSTQVIAAGATAATLAADKQSVAIQGPSGSVLVALAGDSAATLIDDGPGLVAPSVDPFRFVWSARADDASTILTWEVDGQPHPIATGLPSDNAIVSMRLSRDGTRLLLLLSTPVGPRLVVLGVIRQQNVPVDLGEPIDLPVGSGTPVDATWVDDRTVATIASDDAGSGLITAFEVGGPSTSLGRVQGAVAIAGGNAKTDGLRVLTAAGDIWRPRGSEGWVATGISASFLGTKQ